MIVCWRPSPPLRGAVAARGRGCRFGGDEFLVLARGCGHAQAQALAEQLRRTVQAAATAAGVNVSASIGFAIAPTDTRDPVALLQYADAAMYAIKYSGKNRVMPFGQARHGRARIATRQATAGRSARRCKPRNRIRYCPKPFMCTGAWSAI